LIPSPFIIRALTFCLALSFLSAAPCGSGQAQAQTPVDLSGKYVLILHAHEANAPIFMGTDRGFVKTLQAGGITSLNQYYESFDL
jgi:hypothetical protein